DPGGHAGMAVGDPTALDGLAQPRSKILRTSPATFVVRVSADSEHSVVARRDDVHAEPRPPDLDERGILPRRRARPLDTGVDREQRGPRHAVLQTRPRRLPKRAGAGRKPLVEAGDAPAEGEDLRARQLEQG